jgi:hypothetical protein
MNDGASQTPKQDARLSPAPISKGASFHARPNHEMEFLPGQCVPKAPLWEREQKMTPLIPPQGMQTTGDIGLLLHATSSVAGV